jgi:hypothetical protein
MPPAAPENAATVPLAKKRSQTSQRQKGPSDNRERPVATQASGFAALHARSDAHETGTFLRESRNCYGVAISLDT